MASNTDDHFDELLRQYRRRTGREKPVQVVPYRGFGNAREIYLRGRVLEDRNIREASDKDSVWRNLLSMYQRFNSGEIPGVQVQLLLGTIRTLPPPTGKGTLSSACPSPSRCRSPRPGTRPG
jgi:phosphatidate phosphatase APP1